MCCLVRHDSTIGHKKTSIARKLLCFFIPEQAASDGQNPARKSILKGCKRAKIPENLPEYKTIGFLCQIKYKLELLRV
jgi:hypothetical protein